MQDDVVRDQLVVIKVEGMHCHRCEQTISRALHRTPGVHEVEVDFNSKLVSVLHDPAKAEIRELMSAISDAGYTPVSCTRGEADQAAH